MLNVLRLAWLSSVRQPGRTSLGVLGVAAVGALLFDMLLLSRGLVVSFRDLLDRAGFDVRVLATDAAPLAGPRILDSGTVLATIGALPEVEAVVPISIRSVEITSGNAVSPTDRLERVQFIGADPQARPMWTLVEGRDLSTSAGTSRPLLVNRTTAARLQASPGSELSLRGRCGSTSSVLPPLAFTIVGIVEFPFDDADAETVAGQLLDLERLCADDQARGVDMLLVRSKPGEGAERAASAIQTANLGLHVVTNEELVERFSRVEFSYFRQISFVLATVTLFFGFLLIAVLLTASVNQRLGEIAALRAMGLSRWRVVAGVLCESVMMVGAGAILAIPVGAGLSVWLDAILRALPGIPTDVHFFVFETRALFVYGSLLAAASIGAALYPMRIVAVLPIAATLRREVIG
ncbi:MAG TPA: FtsX-like permease family protein [Vicinamibacterales bacterium]|jgi:putative ABC transport system permease protein|nr:FtsX-like permease family protein [Vicinamibacterales bacterium]